MDQFEELYRVHAGRVKAYALRRTSPAAADDVVAEVFLVAWRRLAELPAEPLPWLLGVARRVLANRRRGERRARALHERLALDRPPADAAEPDEAPVVRALRRLGERDRELLMLIAWEGLSHSEAAAALGIRPGALAMRLSRARRRLAVALSAERGPTPVTQEVSR